MTTWARSAAVLAAGALLLAACGEGGGGGGGVPGDDGGGVPGGGGDSSNLTMATGSTGGTYFPLGGEIAQLWSNEIDGVKVTTQASGASVENVRLLESGEAELILAMNGSANQAKDGTGEFEDGAVKDLVALGNVYAEMLQIVATKGSGIESIEDMKGKRVVVGPPGSGTEVAARQILGYYGLDPETDIKPSQDTFSDAATKLRDGSTDAAFAALSLPAASIQEVATGNPITMVDISGEGLTKLLEEEPSFTEAEIPGGTYNGQDDAVTTVTNWATLYAKPDLDEETAYQLVKTMYDKSGDLEHEVAKQITLDTALEGLGSIELHPGAERYFKEKGAL